MDDFEAIATDDFEPEVYPRQDVFDLPQKAAITQWAADVGSKVAPERSADVIRLSAVTGLPPQTVHDSFDVVKEQIDRKRIDYASLAKTHPILSEFLSQPERAGVAQGDEGVLGTIEGLFRGWRDIPAGMARRWDSGARTQEIGRIGVRIMDNRATPDDLKRLGALQAEEAAKPEMKFGYLAGFLPGSSEAASQFFGPFRDAEATARVWGTAGVGALAGAAGLGTATAGAGAPPGAFLGFLGGMAAGVQAESTLANATSEAGNAFLEYRTIPGVSQEEAAAAARLVGLVNGGIEFVALNKVIGLVPGAQALVGGALRGTLREALKDATRRAALGRLVKAIAAKGFVEGAQEAAQEFTTIFEGIRVRPDKPDTLEAFKESFDEKNRARMMDSFIAGTQMSLIGLPSSMVQFHSDYAKAKQAEVNGAMFAALGDTAKSSKTRERLPSVFRSFVDSVQEETGGPVESVKVPASNLNTLFQTEGITEAEVEREMPEVARQMREAVEAGTPDLEVAVPIADMATKIAPLSGYARLHEDMRIGDGLTIRESKKVMKEAERVYTEQKDPAREATPAEKVAEDIQGKLEGTGLHPDAARKQAVLWAAFAEARASRTGAKDAWDYYSKARVEVRRDEKAGAGENTLAQGDKTQTPEFKSWFGNSSVVDAEGKPVVVYHSGSFDETVDPVPDVNGQGFHFGTRDAAQERQYGKLVDDFIKDITVDEQDGRFFWSSEGVDSYDVRGEDGFDSEDDARSDVEQYASDYAEGVNQDAEDAPLTAAHLSIQNVKRVKDQKGDWSAAIAKAKSEGYDGIVYRNEFEDKGKDSYIVFAPTQIKSVNNRGTYSPTDPNILKQTKDDNVRGFVSFDNARTYFSVTLTGKANLSTFLHESGHAFVEMLRRDAAAGHAESQTDLAALEEFAGVQGGAWTVEAQEKLARAFEKYLAEGEAPSNKLEAAFRSFKDWMVMVYRTLVGLNVELDDKTRQVFARLLATDQEINERARVTGLTMPEYGEVHGGVFTEAEYGRLKAMWDDGVDAMKESLLAQSIQAMRKDVEEERVRIEKEVSAELNADKTQNAWAWLTSGRRLDDGLVDLEHDKLAAQAVKDAPITDQERRRLRKVTTEDFGLPADEMAPYFGFESGSALILALARRESLQKARRRMVAERMAALYPEGTADFISQGADAEVAKKLGGRLGRALEAELDAVGAKVGGEKGKVILAAIRQAAARQVASMGLVELDPAKYARAAKKASQDYLDAIAKGEGAVAAFQAKRAQAWALAMWKASTEAKVRGEKIRRYLDSFDDAPKRARMARAGGNYLAAIDSLLDGIEFRTRSGRTLQKRAALAAYLAEMEAAGDTVNIPVEARTEALLKNYRQMSLDELVGVEAAAQNIESLARLKNKLTGIQAGRRLEATATDLVDNIHENWTEKAQRREVKTLLSTIRAELRKGRAYMMKPERILHALDGGVAGGLAQRLIYGPLERAGVKKDALIASVMPGVQKVWSSMTLADRMRLRNRVDFLGTEMRMADVLGLALHWGTQSNRDKVLEGERANGSSWTEEMVTRRLDELMEPQDWQLVTASWEAENALWSETKALSERAIGVTPEKIEGLTIETRHGPVQGQYHPMEYDPSLLPETPAKGRAIVDASQIEQMRMGGGFENNFLRPSGMIQKGFTKARTKYAAPVRFDIMSVPAHIAEVAHFVSHFEAVRDVDKLLRHAQVKRAIVDAVGLELYNEFVPWLQDVANTGKREEPPRAHEKFLRYTRLGSSILLLGGKLTNSLFQLMGFTVANLEVKQKYLLQGARDFWRRGGFYKGAYDESPALASLEKSIDRDMAEMYSRLEGGFQGELKHASGKVADFSLALMRYCQGYVNAVTYYGAKRQAVAENHPDPSAYAVSVVRSTQASGKRLDLSAVQRGSEVKKLLTVMFTWRNGLFNILSEPIPDKKTARQKATIVAARFWFAIMAPVLLAAILKDRGPDDEEPEDWAVRMAKEQLLYAGSSMPVLDDVLSAATENRMPRGNPWLVTMWKTAQALPAVAGEEPLTDTQVRDLVNGLGMMTRTPTAGMWNAFTYLEGLQDGTFEEPMKNLLFRSPGAWK